MEIVSFLQYTAMSDSEILACMSIIDDQLKYSLELIY